MQNFSYSNKLDLPENKTFKFGTTHFHINSFALKTCFDTEAKGNLQMAYCNFQMDLLI